MWFLIRNLKPSTFYVCLTLVIKHRYLRLSSYSSLTDSLKGNESVCLIDVTNKPLITYKTYHSSHLIFVHNLKHPFISF